MKHRGLLLLALLWWAASDSTSNSGGAQLPDPEPPDPDPPEPLPEPLPEPEPPDPEPPDEGDPGDQCEPEVAYLYAGPSLAGEVPADRAGDYDLVLLSLTPQQLLAAVDVHQAVRDQNLVPADFGWPPLCTRPVLEVAVKHKLTPVQALAVFAWWRYRGAAVSWPNDAAELKLLTWLENYFRVFTELPLVA